MSSPTLARPAPGTKQRIAKLQSLGSRHRIFHTPIDTSPRGRMGPVRYTNMSDRPNRAEIDFNAGGMAL